MKDVRQYNKQRGSCKFATEGKAHPKSYILDLRQKKEQFPVIANLVVTKQLPIKCSRVGVPVLLTDKLDAEKWVRL